MTERSLTPNITVTIGHHTRVYFAFVTTAPTELDSPATVTLHAATLADVVTLAAEPVTFDSTRSRTPARLVLVDAMELAWQRAKYRGHQHPLLPADRRTGGATALGRNRSLGVPARMVCQGHRYLEGVAAGPAGCGPLP